jgi:hypothetical protein
MTTPEMIRAIDTALAEHAQAKLQRIVRTRADNPFAHVSWVDDLGIPHFAPDAPDPVPCENLEF